MERLFLVLVLLGLAVFAGAAEKSAVVEVDFGEWVDYPLVKTKFAAYNSGWVPGQVETYKRDQGLLDEVRPDLMRIDGVLGSPEGIIFSSPPIVSGAFPDFRYDFTQADELVGLLARHNVRFLWCHSYIPECLGGSSKTPPANLDAWGKVCGDVARHFKESGTPLAYHEIYNEPDNRDFFAGDVNDYIRLYDAGVKAIRKADPEAVVGGPALAFTDAWVSPFLKHVTANHLPLDFFSYHYYPTVPYKARNVRELVDGMNAELAKYPELSTTEMHLNEYNSLPINYPQDGPQQKHRLAAQLLNDFAYFVTKPALTKVHWAQFMDTGGGNWSGLVSIDGKRKAAFNAWAIYARMPVDRRKVSIEGPDGLGGMASADGRRASLVLWNLTGSEQRVKLSLGDIPFPAGTLRVYRIDAGHASWGDNTANENLIPVETRETASTRNFEWSDSIPDGGVVYLEIDGGAKETSPARVADVDRVLYHFPDRKSKAYADFDRNTWTARLGMGGEKSGTAVVGVLASGLPDSVDVRITSDGALKDNARDSLLGVRVDYQVGDGYTRSVLFHGGICHPRSASPLPWGTKSRPDSAVRVRDFMDGTLELRKHAPKDWTGKAAITFMMRNTGPGARAKVCLEPGNRIPRQ